MELYGIPFDDELIIYRRLGQTGSNQCVVMDKVVWSDFSELAGVGLALRAGVMLILAVDEIHNRVLQMLGKR